ncbi:CHRD domain-containing protein [Armatimonadetes bacterium]|nr:CHRD domain-containing protein [bacterium]
MNQTIYLLSAVVLVAAVFSIGMSATLVNMGYAQAQEQKFTAKLSGDQEVPPVTSSAKGWAWVTPGEESGWFKVNVTGIDKVTAAHIHNAKSGENGDVVVTLFKSESPTGPKDGILVEGNFTASDLEGPMKGKELSDLATAMKNGETYVNVHTEANPKGEIRGQLEMGNDDKTS